VNSCRLCSEPLDQGERLRIAPAPSGAQHFADTADAARAKSISLDIVQCPACALVQATCEPVEGYRRAITAAGLSGPMREHRAAQAGRLGDALGKSDARIALVGCGNGYELSILGAAGFAPTGIESGGAPAGYSGAFPILDGYPELGGSLPGAPYDAFACYNFLEHAPDPLGFLSAIAGSLGADGCGVVEVPNYDRQRAEGRAADYIADHLSYFDPDTFWAMLSAAGFDVLSLAIVREGENLEAIVRVGGDTEPIPAAAKRGTLKRDGELIATARATVGGFFAKWCGAGAPAVAWGASHQALTLFAGLAAAEMPAVIVDGAAFKQGKFAPASGLAIVAPSASVFARSGAVLIIASGYEREIAKALRATHGFTREIWTVVGTEIRPVD
jgi:hypothetical protein